MLAFHVEKSNISTLLLFFILIDYKTCKTVLNQFKYSFSHSMARPEIWSVNKKNDYSINIKKVNRFFDNKLVMLENVFACVCGLW